IRQRADLVVFWGVDPADRYPRYASRYAVDPTGLQAPDGRHSRRVVAVDVGPSRGAADADERVAITPEDEVDALAFMRAVVLGRVTGDGTVARAATGLATQMMRARYVALVHDAEPPSCSGGGRSTSLSSSARPQVSPRPWRLRWGRSRPSRSARG